MVLTGPVPNHRVFFFLEKNSIKKAYNLVNYKTNRRRKCWSNFCTRQDKTETEANISISDGMKCKSCEWKENFVINLDSVTGKRELADMSKLQELKAVFED